MIEKANNKEALNLNNNYKYITPYTLGLVMSSPTNCPIRIGDLLISTISRNPSEDYVGTEWVLLKDRFLIGAGGSYSNGATGGETTHLLTADESGLPSHNHTFVVGTYDASNGGFIQGQSKAHNYSYNTDSSGGWNANQAHNNMPPYLAVYMWKRIK